MPFQTEPCTSLVGQCVVVLFRDLCIGATQPGETPPNMSGYLELTNFVEGPIADSNGALFALSPKVQTFDNNDWTECEINGCTYWAIKTCAIPANIDTNFETGVTTVSQALQPSGTTYTLGLSVGCKPLEWEFQIDAAADYSQLEVCDCIPITALTVTEVDEVDCCDPESQLALATLLVS